MLRSHGVIRSELAEFTQSLSRREIGDWAIPEYREKLVLQLDGFDIPMCFLKTFGDHMRDPTWFINKQGVVS